ncbi:hypothetical protein FV222_01390 [Methylobacterium sp. WL103]|jgi:hypothetical protein|uniref:hypothetical protein n=1 Tax=unclassified Methylobacterium TaxID=2615210 RepID=UPI0011C8C489|nr:MULTISPECIES: hypothetical protein [unclassified Methylobacterium]TXN08029.1 hypothetical protein FV222_01390 [Methylobacterium sp. WL103]TXN15839.1 hypothetical protein FV219_01735 [Methylobacterium sp. WL122]TXN80352.1 hypothetical protein FV234_17340 [Methylobacterium sp. WL8]
MNGSDFKRRLKRLDRTQTGFARENGVALRTVHNWAASGPPMEVVRLLDLMARLEKPFEFPIERIEPNDFGVAVAAELDHLCLAAGMDRRDAFIRSVESWLAKKGSQ